MGLFPSTGKPEKNRIEKKRTAGDIVLYVFTLVVSLIAFVAIGIPSFRFFYNRNYKTIVDNEVNSVIHTATQFEKILQVGSDALRITKGVLEGYSDDTRSVSGLQRFISDQSSGVRAANGEDFTSLYCYIDGVFLDGDLRQIPEGYDPTIREWYLRAVEQPGKIIITRPYSDASTQEGEILVTLALAFDNGVDVVALDLHLNSLDNILAKVESETGLTAYISDLNDNVIARRNINSAASFTDEQLAAIDGPAYHSGEQYYGVTIDNIKYMLFTRSIAESWRYVVLLPEAELFAGVHASLVRNIGILIAIYGCVCYFCTASYNSRCKERALRLQTEEMSKRLQAALEKEELASNAKTRFLFNMSHDIRTPMNAISGFIALAQANAEDPDKVRTYLAKASISGEHLISLINDVLDMSRIETGNITVNRVPVDFRGKTENLMTILKKAAEEKNITLEAEYKNFVEPILFVDPLHCGQIALNVLSNSIKYTPVNGRIIYRLEQYPVERENYIGCRFSAIDNGIGMSEEYLGHIYENFSRENNTTECGVQGTGLGMSIVKNLVDLMGGTIEVKSTLNVGTTVTICFEFEIVRDEAQRRSAEAGEEKHASGTELEQAAAVLRRSMVQDSEFVGMRVLVAEDNEMNREIICEILKTFDISVDAVENGELAVKKIHESEAGRYNLVLMDIQMPVMDGYAATRSIRALKDSGKASVPIVAMTANAFAEDRRIAMEAGMNDHLSKPVDIVALKNTLRKYRSVK